MQRATSKALDDLINNDTFFNVLDHGLIRVIDYMGNDQSIVDAARISYGKGTTSKSDDKGLINYLMRHHHCYHKSMEVLTADGWKKWSDCNQEEEFIVPNPKTKKLTIEKLPVKKFYYKDEMYCFKNNRMSYSVTNGHKMLFKQKYSESFESYKVEDMSKWGHFEPHTSYSLDSDLSTSNKELEFSAFYLGDGSKYCKNKVSFHLKKKRKIDYLKNLLDEIGLNYTIKKNESTVLFVVEINDAINNMVNIEEKSKFKSLKYKPNTLQEYTDIFNGLVNSDGSIKKDRHQIEFCSYSKDLLNIFELCCSMIGYTSKRNSEIRIIAYTNKTRTTLESRKQYHYKEKYDDDVFCATTSTGWLIVRGDNKSIGFICGNTTPFEMCEIKLYIKCPIFVARQWMRHRTASINEYSARYSEVKDDLYIPESDHVKAQHANNKQMSGIALSEVEIDCFLDDLESGCKRQYTDYKVAIANGNGVSRETARIGLTLNTYTEFVWKMDLHNLLHFLRLRIDSHAQYEIRVYADAIAGIIKAWCPLAYEAFEEYRLRAVTFSGKESAVLSKYITSLKNDNNCIESEREKFSNGEWREFMDKVSAKNG